MLKLMAVARQPFMCADLKLDAQKELKTENVCSRFHGGSSNRCRCIQLIKHAYSTEKVKLFWRIHDLENIK